MLAWLPLQSLAVKTNFLENPNLLKYGVSPLFFPLTITAFGNPEGYLSLAIIAFGVFEFIVPNTIIA